MLCKSSTGLVPLMKKMIERMPEVAVVSTRDIRIVGMLFAINNRMIPFVGLQQLYLYRQKCRLHGRSGGDYERKIQMVRVCACVCVCVGGGGGGTKGGAEGEFQ